MERKMFRFESNGITEWVVALDGEDAKRVYQGESNNDLSNPKEMTDNDLSHSYMLDINESEPDPDEVDYDEDDYCNGSLIIGTMGDYLRDYGHYSHYVTSDEY